MRTLLVAGLVACSGASSSAVPEGYLEVGFEISGVSNSTCILVAATGTDAGGQSMSFQIGAPSPPVQNTDLAPSRSAVIACADDIDGGGVTVSGAVPAKASRTANEMCFQTGDVRTELGFDFQQSECPITVTLTCEGVVLYDHIPWSVCH
jgi:hypothetical protein